MPKDDHSGKSRMKAITNAQVAVNNNPADFEAHVKLGEAYFEANQIEDALTAFEQAKQINPDASHVFYWIGRVYERLGPVQDALEAHQHALTLDPTNIGSHVGLGILYFDQLHDYDAALNAFQTGLEYQPDDAFAVALLGITQARMGHIEQAINSLQKALRLEPANPYALGNLSILYLHRKQFEKVIETCQREIEVADGNDAHRLLGIVFTHQGLLEQALDEFEKALALEPQDYEARGALAHVFQSLGRQQEADKQLALAREGAIQDKEYGLACLEAVCGNFEEALRLLETALQKGQVELGWARIDPEFAFMAEHPEFVALFRK